MKGKIDADGCLHIERAGEMREQACPFGDCDATCSHWCPLFAEPCPADGERVGDGRKTVLELCRMALVFDELTDERGKEKE